MNNYTISIYLDKRRKKQNGTFPLKLQVFQSTPRKQKIYSTDFEVTEKEFERTFNTIKPQKEFKALKTKVNALLTNANKVAKQLKPFTFEEFEKKLFRKAGQGINVAFQYNEIIQDCTKKERIGTANSYSQSKNSIEKFCKEALKTNFNQLTLLQINKEWLESYERFMVNKLNRSITTVGIYLRNLRAIFNIAIEEKELEKDFYPFGKRKYQIPAKKNKKKALNNEQLKTLYFAEPLTVEQAKAKDFWFFSYACNGMNIKDILLLRYKDIENDKIEFVRAKTKLTTKANLKTITVYLNDFSKSVIEKYGKDKKTPTSLIFDTLNDSMTPIMQDKKIKNFTRFVNQNINRLCEANNLPQISTYWARHTFATQSIRKGASMEFIQESLGHENLKTTMNYFAGFDDATKKEFANTLMDF